MVNLRINCLKFKLNIVKNMLCISDSFKVGPEIDKYSEKLAILLQKRNQRIFCQLWGTVDLPSNCLWIGEGHVPSVPNHVTFVILHIYGNR